MHVLIVNNLVGLGENFSFWENKYHPHGMCNSCTLNHPIRFV
uniref:Uncharacterized protein n=1 Tax=Arundo donax TaxID=35708 RepID=A0A0A9GW42_ARUDO